MSLVITFIGAGNMTRSLVAGLFEDNSEAQIRIADPFDEQRKAINNTWPGVTGFADNNEAVRGADIVVLAVKPQILKEVCESMHEQVQAQQPLLISIAAGVTIDSISAWLGGALPVVRCMPNTPALVQAGATGLYANPRVSDEQRNTAEMILRSVGITLWVQEEALLDAVTAVSGSGPAYFFLFMESMQAAATSLGLDDEQARLLVLQTALGASRLALESDDDVTELRRKVTSKGGTTAAALSVFENEALSAIVHKAMQAAEHRAKELARNI